MTPTPVGIDPFAVIARQRLQSPTGNWVSMFGFQTRETAIGVLERDASLKIPHPLYRHHFRKPFNELMVHLPIISLESQRPGFHWVYFKPLDRQVAVIDKFDDDTNSYRDGGRLVEIEST